MALSRVSPRHSSHEDLHENQVNLIRFKIAFENLQTIEVLAGELAQTNRVWFLALTLNGSLASSARKPKPSTRMWRIGETESEDQEKGFAGSGLVLCRDRKHPRDRLDERLSRRGYCGYLLDRPRSKSYVRQDGD